MFLGGIERDQWYEMAQAVSGQYFSHIDTINLLCMRIFVLRE